MGERGPKGRRRSRCQKRVCQALLKPFGPLQRSAGCHKCMQHPCRSTTPRLPLFPSLPCSSLTPRCPHPQPPPIFHTFPHLQVTTYWQFLLTRLLTGVSVGGAFPLLYSLLGDMFPISQRAFVSSFIQIATGAGVFVGQVRGGHGDGGAPSKRSGASAQPCGEVGSV